jgi:cell division protein FtsB
MSIDWSPVTRFLRSRGVPILLALALVYFGYHGLHGGRGLLAWVDLNREVEAARSELAELRAERADIERRTKGLARDAIDPDLLEEELRKLGYVGEREVVVLTPEREGATKP